VDIPAAFYTLSFAPNPDFSNVFPPQADIIEYFNGVVERFGVYRHVVPNTEWVGAYWQDLTSTWLVKLKDLSTGGTFYQECKILISAVGGLVNPNTFDVPGVDTFEGDIIHTARWKTDTSLRQKDVIVVGNGCKLKIYSPSLCYLQRFMANCFSGSAAQLVPAIADEAKNITQFMRVRYASIICKIA
jgi:Predicted flavoprotein involved in K+ transport